MFYQLPPVGNPICLSRSDADEILLQDVFRPYVPKFYASGTAALAASIVAAIKLKGASAPEVILPAYGCPDLVSAAVFAGAKPVLADLEPARPWMDPDQVSRHVNTNTVAIVAASLCGVPERMDVLRELAEAGSALLIEDSAQAFPVQNNGSFWTGDLVVLSFGRGKPVSLLGGGALLFREGPLADLVPQPVDKPRGKYSEQVLFRLKAALYNSMIMPGMYWIPQGLPFLHLGETHYKPLSGIDALDSVRRGLLAANIGNYRQFGEFAQNSLASFMREPDIAGEGLVDLPAACGLPQHQRLLRYPLLVDPDRRKSIYRHLRHAGLGPSMMYPASLPAIPGTAALLESQGTFPAADDFARRLLTFPTHCRVRGVDIGRIRRVLSLRGR